MSSFSLTNLRAWRYSKHCWYVTTRWTFVAILSCSMISAWIAMPDQLFHYSTCQQNWDTFPFEIHCAVFIVFVFCNSFWNLRHDLVVEHFLVRWNEMVFLEFTLFSDSEHQQLPWGCLQTFFYLHLLKKLLAVILQTKPLYSLSSLPLYNTMA